MGGTSRRATGRGDRDLARPESAPSRLVGIRSPSPPGSAALPGSASHASTRNLRVGGLALVLSLLTTFATAAPAFAWAPSAFSPTDEQLLFTLTNQDRASAGLSALTNDSYLHKEAEWRAKDMADRDYFSHAIPPANTKVFDDMQADGYCFKVAGENIGLSTYSDSTATTRIEAAFMGSTSHRDNILGTWQRLGVGAYKAADGRKLYVVLFSVPCGSKAKPVSKPVSKPAPKPTGKPAPQPAPTAQPTTQPTVTATAATPGPTAQPTAQPTVTATAATPGPNADPAPVSSPAGGPVSPDLADPNGASISLRVRESTPSQGPLDPLFKLLFGGLFG